MGYRKNIPDKCPDCGCMNFYATQKPIGKVRIMLNVTDKTAEYSEFYDGLSFSNRVKIFCNSCGKLIGYYSSDILQEFEPEE